jgi:DNA polymerase/3'-5' exonuclease PolX
MAPYNLLPFYLLYFGSGESFSREIRKKAKNQGYKLSEFGLIRNNKIIMNKANNEKEIFNKLNLPYILPHNR